MAKRLLFFFAFLVFHFAGYGSSYKTIIVKDSISTNTTWSYTDSLNDCIQYLIKGTVYVTAGNSLTIDSGTIIRGDKVTKGTLVIEQGAKLVCNGTCQMPVIFTSNQPQGSRSYGDWGGIIICGKAPLNTNSSLLQFPGIRSYYGGNIASDNSGQLSYVRIEFAGAALSPNNELNGLTLCGVGSSTQIDHIQVSYSGNDSYGWFGGTVNAKYLISHRTMDDDFETNQGYNGLNQYLIALRDPYAADQSGSVIFDCNGFETRTPVNPTLLTMPVFSNATVVGPMVNATSTAYDAQHVAAARWRRGAGMSILNSILMGHVVGLYMQEPASYPSTVGKIGNYNTQFRNNIVAGMSNGNKEIYFGCDSALMACDTIIGVPWNAITGFSGPWNWLKNTSYFNKLYASAANGLRLQNPFDLTSPKFNPTSTSPICFNNGQNYLGIANSNIKPFNTANPINLDTTSNYINYNAPAAIPDFTSTKANNPYFDNVNYVGAFPYNTGDWTIGWTNFDPNNTWYEWEGVIENTTNTIQSATLYPNPAKSNTTVSINIVKKTQLKVILTDMIGRIVAEVVNGMATVGNKEYHINLQNLNTGVYNVMVTCDENRENLKLIVQ